MIDQPDNYESSGETVVVDCDSSVSNSSSQTFLVDDLANRYRKHPTRGGKRGRPRGSRRGHRGGLNRPDIHSRADIQQMDIDSSINNAGESANRIRRGPGRPRLKQNGPSNQGQRSIQKYRKPIAPLVVPLGSSPAPTPTTMRSPAMSPERS